MKKNFILLILFCTTLILPIGAQVLEFDYSSPNNENRILAEKPRISWTFDDVQRFPREFQSYYNDNFGLRNILIFLNYYLRYECLGASPSNQVVIGKNGWLYYTGDGDLDDYRGITRFDENKLSRMTSKLIQKKKWLEEKGIRYLLVIPPNKSTIYYEHIPDAYKRVRNSSELDDLFSYLKNHEDLSVLDLRSILYEGKNEHTLYYHLDTHWNNYGAFLAYREITKYISNWFPSIVPYNSDDFDINHIKKTDGELIRLIGGRNFTDDDYVFTPKKPYEARFSQKPSMIRAPFTIVKNGSNLPRAVIFHDSFFEALTPFFSQHFSVSHYVWKRMDNFNEMEKLIEEYHPDIVVEEIVERLIKNMD